MEHMKDIKQDETIYLCFMGRKGVSVREGTLKTPPRVILDSLKQFLLHEICQCFLKDDNAAPSINKYKYLDRNWRGFKV